MDRNALKVARTTLKHSLEAQLPNSDSLSLKRSLTSTINTNLVSLTNACVKADDVRSVNVNIGLLNSSFIDLGDLRNKHVNITSMENCELKFGEIRNCHVTIEGVSRSTLVFGESRNCHFYFGTMRCGDLQFGEMRNCHLNVQRISDHDVAFEGVRNSHINVNSASDVTTTYNGDSRNSHWNVPSSFEQPLRPSSSSGGFSFGNVRVGGNVNVRNVVIGGVGQGEVTVNGRSVSSNQNVFRSGSSRGTVIIGGSVIVGGNTRSISMRNNGSSGTVTINGRTVSSNGGNLVINNGNVRSVSSDDSDWSDSSEVSFDNFDEVVNDRPARGLSSDRIGRFERFTADADGQQCDICFDDLVAHETEMVRLDCGHVMCRKCAGKWFGEHATCPTCRHAFV